MEQWLPLTDYATKYKVSVSTLRRRIKTEDIKYLFQEGKYFICDQPISMVSKASPSLGYPFPDTTEKLETLNFGIESPDFLEQLKKTATTKLPQVKNEVGMLNKNKPQVTPPAINLEEEYYFKNNKSDKVITAEFEKVKMDNTQTAIENSGLRDFSEKIAKIGNNEPILTAANKLLAELKRAYTQILQEKEEQIMTLKEEVSDLKTLVKVLESENLRLKNINNL